MHLSLIERDLSILKKDERFVPSIPAQGFFCFLRTPGEVTVVGPRSAFDVDSLQAAHGWAAFQVQGPLDFSLTGVLADLSAPLATAKISLFALSSYDTDMILVRSRDVESAAQAWCEAGHTVTLGA